MFNYHELAATQPGMRQNGNQYLFLIIVGGAFLAHAILSAGTLHPVKIKEGTFPGGEFVYKYRVKDYAASIGTMRLAAEDLGMDYTKADTGNFFYTIYLDDQGEVPPGQERMLSGLLSRKTSEMKEQRRSLMERNKSIGQGVCKINDKECMEKYENIPWEIGTLPSVKAAIVEFPFANGIISALVHSYKIMPQLLKYSNEHGSKGNFPLTISTCNVEKRICTHYAPLEKGQKFLLGRHQSKEYAKILGSLSKGDSFDDIVRYLYRGFKKYFNLS